MGVTAALWSRALGAPLVLKALWDALPISAAVLASGLVFKALRERLATAMGGILRAVPFRAVLFGLVVLLGLASSVITAIIASLVLVEIAGVLDLERRQEVRLVIITCFSIGLGAALTPVGEPLSTILVSKLGEGFWFPLRLVGLYIVPGIVALGFLASFYVRRRSGLAVDLAAAALDGRVTGSAGRPSQRQPVVESGLDFEGVARRETYGAVLLRALKIYLFVMALVFLGEGFKPAIDRFVIGLPSSVLYWLNMVSAILDNATLTAAEVSVKMSTLQVRSILMGLLISGGMLIPGNIPNIVSAGKLDIGSREWGALGVPLGLALMFVYFIILFI